MAYNNYQGGRRDGGSRNWQGGQQEKRPILAADVPEDYVDQAERIMLELSRSRQSITTSKIRNLLSLASQIYDAEKLRTDKELLPDSVAMVGMLRVRTAYEYGREKDDNGPMKNFVRKARLLEYLKGIGKDREKLIRFAGYMEALVAYHRYYGGKEN